MRTEFSKKIQDERVSAQEGTFGETHVPDGWADLIVIGERSYHLKFSRVFPNFTFPLIAQAFHWCPDYDKAVAEFNRVLSPDGRVVFIWNLEGETF